MTDAPERPLGWCTGYKQSTPGMRPIYWWIYLHTRAGCYKLDGITFPDEPSAQRWAIKNLPGLPEYE